MLFQNPSAVLVVDVFRDEASHVQEFGLPFASCQLSWCWISLWLLLWQGRQCCSGGSARIQCLMCGSAVKSELCIVKPKLDKADKC